MPEVKIILEVDDKGTVKIKKFADESKKAFDQMQEGPKAAQEALNSLKESWIGLTAKIGIVVAALYAAKRMFYDTAVQIAGATNEIKRQAEVLGIGTDELQKWQYAAKMSDINAQELAIGIKLLSKNMEDASSGSAEASKYFSAMGISVKTTQGHLRPLNEVMGDIMDKFASWEDGPRKIAIALQLFGRSGETLIPLLNKGKSGFEELAKEAQKLGIILSPDLVRKGSEAEDQFKKIEAQITATKLSLAPAALEFAKAIGWIVDDLKKLFTMEPPLWVKTMWGLTPVGQAGVAKGWLRDIDEKIGLTEYLIAQEKKLGIQPETPYRRITDPKDKTLRVKPPTIAEKPKTTEEDSLSAWNAEVARANELGEVFLGQQELAEILFWRQKTIQENLMRIEGERAEQFANDMFPALATINTMIEKAVEWGEKQRLKWVEIQDLVKNFGWEDYASGASDASSEATRKLNKMAIAAQQASFDISKLWEGMARDISNAWSSNMVNIIRSTESTSEKIKSFFQSIADVFLSTISKMIANWLIFGNLTGQSKEKGGGWGGVMGVIGSVVGGLVKHEGGIVDGSGPTRSMPLTAFAFAPKFHTGFMPGEYPAILKKGEGVFTPDQMKALGGDTHNYYIDARGSQRGVSIEIMRAIKESENRAVVRSVNQVADSKLRGGKFAKIFKD